jgi:putative sigma-54 modulation protein
VQVKVSTRHGHLTPDAQQMIREKAEKLLHFFSRLMIIEVTVDLQDEANKLVEIVAKAEHKHDFVAHERRPELVAAVDAAVKVAEEQIRRYKEKLQDHRRDVPTGHVGSGGH